MVNGINALVYMITSPGKVSINPNCFIKSYNGLAVTIPGIKAEATIAAYTSVSPFPE